MLDRLENENLWSQRYRPQKVDDVILPANTKKIFKKFVEDKEVPNLLLSSGPGMGKTTIAKATLNEIGADWILINGSLENGIDVLRNKIANYASSVSFSSGKKYVILDESDYLNASSIQPALRAFMEEFSSNCGFIFACNSKHRIISPLRSRLSEINFDVDKDDKPVLQAQFFKRIVEILKTENVDFDKAVVAKVIQKYFPDFRRTINELQQYSASGKIDEGIFVDIKKESIDTIFSLMKNKKFNEMRKWVAENSNQDVNVIIRKMYEAIPEKIELSTQPGVIILLADYQYKHNLVADPEINLMACITEIMMEAEIL